jgi:hypothetical protein
VLAEDLEAKIREAFMPKEEQPAEKTAIEEV